MFKKPDFSITRMVGYRSGRANLKVSAIGSCALAGLLYISSCFSNNSERKNAGVLVSEDLEVLVQDSPASGNIEVYPSINMAGSYILFK